MIQSEKKKKMIGLIGILIASAGIAAGAFFSWKKQPEPVTKDMFALDTFCTITLYAGSCDLQEAADHAADVLRNYDTLFDANREGSDIRNVNFRSEARVSISQDTASMLSMAKDMETFTDGALWPGVRPLTELWDIKNRTTVPQKDQVEEALAKSRNASWEICGATDPAEKDTAPEAEMPAAFFAAANEETKIEVGAFAKGYITDRIKEELVLSGVTSAIIDLGGNVQTVGRKTDGEPFRVGIRDPEGVKSYVEIVEADDISVVTAGTYQRYFEAEGKRYHHIIDPVTGMPSESGLVSVTVWGPSSFVCDCLATASVVLGKEKAEDMIRRYNEVNHAEYKLYCIEEK